MTLDWTEELSSDQVQVSRPPTFASTIVDSFMFITSELTTSSLPVGTLYWRARGYDDAFTAGPWSQTRTLTIG